MDELGHKVEKESPYVFVRQLQKTEKNRQNKTTAAAVTKNGEN